MPAGKPIFDYFKKRASTIRKLLKKTASSYSAEDYHRLRVEIKKVLAVISMSAAGIPKSKLKKKLKPARKIFRSAGKVRTMQLETEMLEKLDRQHKLKAYLHSQQLRELKSKKEFSKVQHHIRHKLNKSLTSFLPLARKINNEDAIQYLVQLKMEINIMVAFRKLNSSQVHALRKKLKQLYYNMKSIGMNIRPGERKNGERLLDMIGKWHDCDIMIVHLARDVEDELLLPTEKKALMEIKQKVKTQSSTLFRQINTLRRKRLF